MAPARPGSRRSASTSRSPSTRGMGQTRAGARQRGAAQRGPLRRGAGEQADQVASARRKGSGAYLATSTSTSASSAALGVLRRPRGCRAPHTDGCRPRAAPRAAGRGSACHRAAACWRCDEPPNQLRALPCWNCASTSRGCTTPRSRTKSSTACGLRPARLRPRGARRARVHQRVHGARHEAVVDEEVLLDRPAAGSGAPGRRRGSRARGGAASGPARAPARGSGRPARSPGARSPWAAWSA